MPTSSQSDGQQAVTDMPGGHPRHASIWLLPCILLSILCSVFIGTRQDDKMIDFRIVFYGARSLLDHHDPYNPKDFETAYRMEGGTYPSDPSKIRAFGDTMFSCINVPSALLIVAPLALLPAGVAHLLWRILTAVSLALAAFLMGRIAGRYAPSLSLLLICFTLLNTILLFTGGNAAGIVVSLCAVAVWCFVEERFELAGVLCLGLALAFKPQDAGLVWLYFLLASSTQRKRALQSLLVVAALAVPAVLWVGHLAPHWMQEMNANMLLDSAHNGTIDPGLSARPQSLNRIISLQSVIGVFRDDPRFYNSVSYIVCGLLLLAWVVWTLRTRFSRENAWLALAAVASLSMLPVYHRLYDAKLLLLAVPACAMLWARGGRLKWPAALLTTAAIVTNADIPSILLLSTTGNVHAPVGLLEKMGFVVLLRPFAPMLLAAGVFYLYVYLRRTANFTTTLSS